MKKVAIESSLSHVKNYLKNQEGYIVSDLKNDESNLNNYDVIVVSGQNSNLLGMQDTNTKAMILNAKGMNAEDVYRQLENRLS